MQFIDQKYIKVKVSPEINSSVKSLDSSAAAKSAILNSKTGSVSIDKTDLENDNNIIHKICFKIEIALNEQEIEIKDSPFNASRLPSIKLIDYFHRIFKYSQVEEYTIYLTLIYLDRYFMYSQDELTRLNVFKLSAIALLIAAKFNEDLILNKEDFSKVFGIQLYEMNSLEIEFLKTVEFDLTVGKDDFVRYKDILG